MSWGLRAGVSSDVGPFRSVNQDAAFAASWGAAVADGVGGGPAGDLASAALVHRLVAGGRQVADAEALALRLRGANWDLGAHVRRDPSLAGMATTFTGLWIADDEATLLLAHTGDSRAYLLRDGHLIRQTRDDSFVQALVDQGLVSPEDAMTHPRRNIITASLRGDARDVVRVVERVPVVGDRWLLCSDGVSDYLPDDVIREELALESDPVRAAHALVSQALDAGSRDNVTAVVCDVATDVADELSAPVFAGAAAARFLEGLDTPRAG
ncbi:PP2C family protein-serine/threonine phosphatase [Microbacterium telephonicum]|uniref:Protein phosphatase n=1 Tax=Microbacterium telephonicum TaxID=1714841 RepID=A0A498C3A0_9MICO|nr:protein phosphatase 2C domain-containing protein [Microbacterium telephonicum]RLK49633.1 protein phosphatase [Microbacterium telephonicum]